jgi:hypothetical protein
MSRPTPCRQQHATHKQNGLKLSPVKHIRTAGSHTHIHTLNVTNIRTHTYAHWKPRNRNKARKAVGETPQELQSSPRRPSVCQRVHSARVPCTITLYPTVIDPPEELMSCLPNAKHFKPCWVLPHTHTHTHTHTHKQTHTHDVKSTQTVRPLQAKRSTGHSSAHQAVHVTIDMGD